MNDDTIDVSVPSTSILLSSFCDLRSFWSSKLPARTILVSSCNLFYWVGFLKFFVGPTLIYILAIAFSVDRNNLQKTTPN